MKVHNRLFKAFGALLIAALLFGAMPMKVVSADASEVNPALQAGADRLVALQNDDGGWDWPLDDGNSATGSAANTIGPIAKGLAEAYLLTGDASHLAALQDAGAFLLTKTNNFSPSDGYLAAALDSIFGGTTYKDYVNANFYGPLAAGTYDRNGAGTEYSTATYVDLIQNARSGSNLGLWDIGIGLVGAAQCGADTTEWIQGVKDEINEFDVTLDWDVIGLAGGLYSLAYVGEDFDPTAGDLSSASDLGDLANILITYQISNGGFSYTSQSLISGDESIQETAYAILALNEVDRITYLSNIIGAADYMLSVRLGTGGWEQDSGSGENNEITAEAMWGIATAYPVLQVCPGEYTSIQSAVTAASSGDTIFVCPGTYTETGQFDINKDLTIIGASKDSVTIKPTQSTVDSGDAKGWFFVRDGMEFNLSNVTLDGASFDIHQAIRSLGSGKIDNNNIKNISSPGYNGIGMVVMGNYNMTFSNNTFSNIGRIGMMAYGAGVTDAQIINNTYVGKGDGDYIDYGIEIGGGAFATISGNEISGIGESTTIWGNAAIMVTTLYGDGSGATITENYIHDNYQAIVVGYDETDTSVVTVHENVIVDNYIDIESTGPFVDATLNYWGTPCGPDYVIGDVDYTPWYSDQALTTEVSTGTVSGTVDFASGSTLDFMQGKITCAVPGTIFNFEEATYPGGLVISRPGLTFNLNGATVGHGSSAFEILGDNITINGPGIIDGTGSDPADNAILVQDGADNLIIDGVEVRNWTEAINVLGSHESFKLVNSYLHSNAVGFLTGSESLFTGVVTIEGNLFKANSSHSFIHNGAEYIDATYNSWGADTGPVVDTDVVGNVYADPWVFSEIYLDMDPATTGDDYTATVTDQNGFEVAVMADAENLSGLSFIFTYDTSKLVMDTTPTWTAPWDTTAACVALDGLTAGQVGYRCNFVTADYEWDGGEVARFTFHAIDSGKAIFDILHEDELQLSSGALGGVKIWVNNAGFNAASTTDRDVTDENDGEIDLFITQFTGFVDLQGRPNDSGALLSFYAEDTGSTLIASGTSESSGKYLTAYESGQYLDDDLTYYVFVDRDLFLPTHAYLGVTLPDSPLTSLAQLLLLGGDATNDNLININDATCIGGAYGGTPAVCGSVGWNDVNEDGVINIYDLTLMGGNYSKTESTWTP